MRICIYPTCVQQAYVFVSMPHAYFFMPSNFVVQYNEPTLNKSNNIGKTTTATESCMHGTRTINQLAKWFSLRLKKTVTWKTPIVTMTELTALSFSCYSVCPLIFCVVCKHVNETAMFFVCVCVCVYPYRLYQKKINGLSFDLFPAHLISFLFIFILLLT